jgi:signal peptidase I
MDFTSLTTALSNLSITEIVWFTVTLTAIRLLLVRFQSAAARAIVEIVEAALIAGVLVFLIIQPFFVKAFYIPSGSMRPGLIDNDHILVNRFLYRMHGPRHEDVVVFNAPKIALDAGGESVSGSEDYIKRLIGLPGDTIQVVGGTITINGIIYTHDDVRRVYLPTDDSAYSPDQSKDQQHIKFTTTGISVYDGTKWTDYPASNVALKLNGSANANIKISPGYVIRNGKRLIEPYIAEDPDYNLRLLANGQVATTMANHETRVNSEWVDSVPAAQMVNAPLGKVPPGEVIVMGDNRNDSNDSSCWGPLTEDRLVGRAVFIFFPFSRIREIR